MAKERKTLGELFFPIFWETLFYMMAGMVDTLMLSTLNDKAVGAVGTVNTYLSIFIIMFNIISSGMIAVMTQYIGAGKEGVAYQARQLGLIFNAATGIMLSLLMLFGSKALLNLFGVAPALMEYARTYIIIVGGFSIINAIIPIFSSYLRAFGFTKQPMIATISANVINIILNAVFLFACKWGVMGVALATVISRMVNLAIVITCSAILVKAKEAPDRMKTGEVLGQILRIGFPSALETALYNFAMTLTVRFLNQMDSEGINVTARAYTMQIANFSYCAGAALASANAIMTGWRIGAHEYDECKKGTNKAALIGIGMAILLETTFAVFGKVLIGFFTEDVQIIELARKLLFIDIALEIGRATNLVFGQALKTSGDAVFTTVIGAIFMYLFMVGGTYVFGIRLGLMAVGAYIGMASDECARAVCMFIRWQRGKWKQKGFIKE